MRSVKFDPQAFKDYTGWADKDKKIFKKINKLIKCIDQTPFKGEGKPEPLKHQLAGFWSRHINKKDRLIYKISQNNEIVIAGCKGHYNSF